jgi:hypothetical protein
MPDESEADDYAGAVEECLEDIDEFLATLQRYPDLVIAQSLRIHLAALLRALVDNRLCSREDVREFVLVLEQDSLGVGET